MKKVLCRFLIMFILVGFGSQGLKALPFDGIEHPHWDQMTQLQTESHQLWKRVLKFAKKNARRALGHGAKLQTEAWKVMGNTSPLVVDFSMFSEEDIAVWNSTRAEVASLALNVIEDNIQTTPRISLVVLTKLQSLDVAPQEETGPASPYAQTAILEALRSSAFKFMSANMLSPKVGKAPKGNDWDPYRRRPTSGTFKKYLPDVVGTQETNHQFIASLREDLQDLYTIVDFSDIHPNLEKHVGHSTMVAHNEIMFLGSRFELLEKGVRMLNTFPAEEYQWKASWGAKVKRSVVWVRLKDKIADREFYFVNTHFDHQSVLHRQESLKIICDEILPSFRPSLPVCLSGDFNWPYGALACLLKDKGFDAGAYANIDGVLVSPLFTYHSHRVLKEKINGISGSDHPYVLSHVTWAGHVTNLAPVITVATSPLEPNMLEIDIVDDSFTNAEYPLEELQLIVDGKDMTKRLALLVAGGQLISQVSYFPYFPSSSTDSNPGVLKIRTSDFENIALSKVEVRYRDRHGVVGSDIANPAPERVMAFTNSGQSWKSLTTQAVALGDMNGDASLDIVEVSRDQNVYYLDVWFNNGQGKYEKSDQELLIPAGAIDVTLGDLDGDADLDVVVAHNTTSSGNTVWLNKGEGLLEDSGQSLGSGFTRSIDLGDVDGDGDLDMICGNFSTPSEVWLNDGDGHFQDSGQVVGSGHTNDIVLGDLDNDGDLDIVEATASLGALTFINDGAGHFLYGGQSFGTSELLSADLGDVDGDGDLDALFAGTLDPLWINDGTGKFSPSGQSFTPLFGGNPVSDHSISDFLLGDLDNDGDLDVVGIFNGRADEVWLNDGSGSFTNSFTNTGKIFGTTHSNSKTALGDIDGDGDLDVFQADSNTDIATLHGRRNRTWINTGSFAE